MEQEIEPRTRSKSVPIWRTGIGIVLALVAFELILHPFSGQILQFRYGTRPVHEDRLDSATLTVPYYLEGFSRAHFSSSRARLTGNETLPAAPFVVIVGDSFVEALQVNDQQTMGSVLERTARMNHRPLNVRQYGFSGDSPAHYALIAHEIEQVWKPEMVCVVVNADDFTLEALKDPWAEMKMSPNGVPTISAAAVDEGRRRQLHVWATAKLQHSGLLFELVQRTTVDILPTFYRHIPAANTDIDAEERADPAVIQASVQALKDAYGSDLMILFIQNPGISGGFAPTQLETTLGQACAQQGVECLMTREAFVKLRDRKQQLGFGFSNTLPAAGHINAAGHKLAGQMIWAEYQRRSGHSR